ncbi:hypothetical protein EV121DRAFT_284915 [Schizophyllum commune]
MKTDRRANYEPSQAAGSFRKSIPGSPNAQAAMKRGAPSGDQIAGPSKRKRRSGKPSGSDTPNPGSEEWQEKSRAPTRLPTTMSSSGNSSSRSVQPSPTASTGMVRPPSRIVDEDYDEHGASAADALIGLASAGSGSYRQARHSDNARAPSHRNSTPSQLSPLSPPAPPTPTLKRPPSHAGSEPASRSPDTHEPYQASSSLPVVLPAHPRPIGNGGGGRCSSPNIALPPIATLQSPESPQEEREDRMQVDRSLRPRRRRRHRR